MAEIRIITMRLPESDAKEFATQGLTEAQAIKGAKDAIFWIDQNEKILVVMIPVSE